MNVTKITTFIHLGFELLYDLSYDESINIVMLCGLLNSMSPLAEFLYNLLTTISYSSNASPIISCIMLCACEQSRLQKFLNCMYVTKLYLPCKLVQIHLVHAYLH